MSEKDIKKSKEYMNDSLVSFLTSSINIELVHVILKSISRHTSGKAPSAEEMQRIIKFDANKYTETHKFTLDSIKVKDPEKWAVVKLPQFLDKNNHMIEDKESRA